MAEIAKAALGAALVLWAALAPAADRPLALAIGPQDPVSARLAEDLAAALQASGIGLAIHPAPGPHGALSAVRRSPGIQLGIVAGDVPELLARQGVAGAEGVAALLALDPRPVHLLATGLRRGIEDLGGARVGIGPVEGPTAATAALLLSAARVRPAGLDTRPLESALTALIRGELDALFLVGPSPHPLLARAVDRADGIRLLPLSPAAQLPGHEPQIFAAGTYAFQADPVESVAVRTALVAYLYNGPTCARLEGLISETLAALPTLRRHGEPAWQRVVPEAGTGFPAHPCGGVAGPNAGGSVASPTAADGTGDANAAEAGRQLMQAIGSFLGGAPASEGAE